MSIAFLSAGTGGTQLQIDPTHLAARVSLRPLDLNLGGVSLSAPFVGGFYRSAAKSGALTTVAAGTATAGTVWSFRWTAADVACHILWVKWYWITTTAFGSPQLVDHALYVARGWSVADTGGTNAGPVLATDQKKRTAFVSESLLGSTSSVQVGTTGALTVSAATNRTLDSQPIKYGGSWSGAIGASYVSDDYATKMTPVDETPVVLTFNEGLVLNNMTLMGATGVISLYVEIAWAEIPQITY